MNYAQLLLPDFSLILCGYLVCRYTALNRNVWQQVESLVYFFLFPVLLFHSIVKSPLDFQAASGLIGAGLTLGLCGIALAYSLPWWPGLRGHVEPRLHAAAAQIGFRFNGFIALALAERLAGPEGLLLISVLSIRHLILPLIAWGMTRVLELPPNQAAVLMVFSALPAASSSYVLAARMGYDGAYVAGLVTLSTLLAMLSLPLAIGLR